MKEFKFNYFKLHLWFSCFTPLILFESWFDSPYNEYKSKKWFYNENN